MVFISGNMPMRTEIAPLLIVTQLEQYDYAGATAIAAVLLVISFALLLGDQRAAALGRRRFAGAEAPRERRRLDARRRAAPSPRARARGSRAGCAPR